MTAAEKKLNRRARRMAQNMEPILFRGLLRIPRFLTLQTAVEKRLNRRARRMTQKIEPVIVEGRVFSGVTKVVADQGEIIDIYLPIDI
jgi:hypothetical protein